MTGAASSQKTSSQTRADGMGWATTLGSVTHRGHRCSTRHMSWPGGGGDRKVQTKGEPALGAVGQTAKLCVCDSKAALPAHTCCRVTKKCGGCRRGRRSDLADCVCALLVQLFRFILRLLTVTHSSGRAVTQRTRLGSLLGVCHTFCILGLSFRRATDDCIARTHRVGLASIGTEGSISHTTETGSRELVGLETESSYRSDFWLSGSWLDRFPARASRRDSRASGLGSSITPDINITRTQFSK